MPTSARSLFEKALTDTYFTSLLFVKKISEEPTELKVCFILAVIAVPIAFAVVYSVVRFKRRRREGTEGYALSFLRNTGSGMSDLYGPVRAVHVLQRCKCGIVLYWSRLLHPFSSNITSEAFMKLILLSFHLKGLRYIDHWASP